VLSTNGAGPDLGLGDILRHDPAASNGTADMIVGPDGRPQGVPASARLWWEEQEAKALAAYERKTMRIETASFEL
jgi:hypothetical protein